jgi:hypothetical protein
MSISQKNTKSQFSAAFTAGGILFREFNAVLPLCIQTNKITLLNREKLENKYLSINSEASRKRVLQEIIKRVKLISDDFLDLYKILDETQQRLMLYYLCLEEYPLVKEFHFEVTLSKWRTMNRSLDMFEYKMNLDEIAAKDAEVDSWTDKTKEKVLTVYIRMLNEAGFVVQNLLIKPNLSPELASYIIKRDKIWFLEACFLNEPERKSLIEYYK